MPPKNRRTLKASTGSESEEDGSNLSNNILETILKEVREIKTQNKNFKEETKKELETIRKEIQQREETWNADRNNMQEKISEIESKMENKINIIESKIQQIAHMEERRQKTERKENIIIKCSTEEGGGTNMHQDIQWILETIQTEVSYRNAEYLGDDWKGRKMIRVKMENFEDKLEVMKNKRRLEGTDCYIENDLTKEERGIQAELRRRAREEASKGHTVKIGYKKIQINGQWHNYNAEESKNELQRGEEKQEVQRRRTL